MAHCNIIKQLNKSVKSLYIAFVFNHISHTVYISMKYLGDFSVILIIWRKKGNKNGWVLCSLIIKIR